MIDEDNKVIQNISNKIISRLKAKGLNVITSMFIVEFISDGIYEKVFSGDSK